MGNEKDEHIFNIFKKIQSKNKSKQEKRKII